MVMWRVTKITVPTPVLDPALTGFDVTLEDIDTHAVATEHLEIDLTSVDMPAGLLCPLKELDYTPNDWDSVTCP